MRIFATCLGYNTPEMIEGALRNFDDTTFDIEHRRMVKNLFIPGFPLPSPGENRRHIADLAAAYGWNAIEISNAGVMENHNRAIHEYCHMTDGDFYICFDPDVRIQQKGWVSAAIEGLRSDPTAVFCCAALPFHDEEWCWKQHGREIETLPTGLRIARYKALIAWSMGVWKGEWLASRPRDFKAVTALYGWTEHADIDRMVPAGKTWLSLVDFYDHHQPADERYQRWKQASAKGETSLQFDIWLATEGQ